MTEAGHVTVRGLAIAYDRAGQGTPLVLLHGIGANAAAWRPQLAALSDAFDVIAWDAPGYGRSADPPEDWPMAEYADCLAGFLDGLGIAQAHLLGQSWGGVLAQEFYGRYADRVCSLILSDTTLGGDVTRADGETRLQARLHALATMTPAAYARARAPRLLAPDPPAELLHEVETMFAQIHPAGFRSAAIALAHADVRAVLPRIRVPTLVLCGAQDQITSPALGTRLIGEIPGARRVIFPAVGHLNNMEQPDQYNATVREFLATVMEEKR
ncbi:MAG: alpha/beta hydrolase [Thermomicrobia bacterium]|nr:alpha/beta hydrolase [Thermomicrobia bacterium]MCA1724024.1 alpha/beta hydrolase [Thermomicrobia bacterium]